MIVAREVLRRSNVFRWGCQQKWRCPNFEGLKFQHVHFRQEAKEYIHIIFPAKAVSNYLPPDLQERYHTIHVVVVGTREASGRARARPMVCTGRCFIADTQRRVTDGVPTTTMDSTPISKQSTCYLLYRTRLWSGLSSLSRPSSPAIRETADADEKLYVL